MPRRQKILIALVTAMLVAYLADMAYRRLYAQPLLDAQRAIGTLGKRLHEGKLNVRRERIKLRRLEDLQLRSLPSNPELAVSSYRSWLLRLIEQAGLQRTSVDSSPPLRQGNLYYRLDFTVHSSGTLQQITEFLRSFYGCGYLHKIRSMSLNPTASGEVDASITIETLVLPTAKYEDRLASVETIESSLPAAATYRVIAQRNLFAGGDPVSSNITLTAITTDAQGQPQAWISVQSSGQTHILTTDDVLSLQGIDLRIVRIEPNRVVVDQDGQSHEFSIGMTLADAPVVE